MTDIIYQRGAVRENAIWPSFLYNGPFGATAIEERTTLFGLYANTYLHGHNYLEAIETEDLARLVDTYTVNMAQLTNDEAQTVLEITAKRYIEKITNQIHAADVVTREKKLEALDDEYDARTEALDADYAALQTMRDKVQLAWDRADQKIKDLEMRVELEDVAQQLVDVDIAEQRLRAARADLAVITATLKGLDIQLAITQTGIDITNTDLQITQAENEIDMIGIRVSETEVQESGVDLDITNAGISLSKAVAAGEKIKVDISGVAVRVAETQLQAVEEEAKQSQMTAQIAGINADISKLGLIDSELTITQADARVKQAENELLRQERGLITSQGVNISIETSFREDQKAIRETLDDNIQSNDQGKHDFDMDVSSKTTEIEDTINDKKIDLLEGEKKTLIDDIKNRKYQDAKDRLEIKEQQKKAHVIYSQAAVDAAQMLADAQLITKLSHSVGEGEMPTPIKQSWPTMTMT
jgi:hypothetical protein